MDGRLDCAIANSATADAHSSASADRPSYQLRHLALSDVVRSGSAIRQMAQGADTMEEVASRMVRYFYESYVDPETGDNEIALVRFFKTQSYGSLNQHLRDAAATIAPVEQLTDRTKCLVLLATAGDCPEWNFRQGSTGHQAIPLVSEEAVTGIPMISQLVRQFGLELSYVIDAAPELMIELDERSYNVFHVEHALNSPYIPAQAKFVQLFGIRSVLGFGGMLPTGNLFTVILFAKTHIPQPTSEAFRTIALSVKTAILPFEDTAVFPSDVKFRENVSAAQRQLPDAASQLALYRSKSAALEELGRVYDRMVIDQSSRLEHAVTKLEQSNQELALEMENRRSVEADRERIHNQLMITSRRAGMAEIATGVLHNVGNVLNSVNVSSTLVRDLLRHSKSKQLQRVCDLFDQHRDDLASFLADDAQGKRAPDYLKLLTAHLAEEQAAIAREMEQLISNVDHIKTIVSTQQSYAGVSGLVEPVQLRTLLDDVIKMDAASLQRHQIQVDRDDADLPPVLLDRQKVLQILINLIQNARDVLMECGPGNRRIGLKSTLVNEDRLSIIVTDTGVGIRPENLDRIFTHGFTTKRDGHGFGLHASAIAAKEMQGSLTVQSGGLGAGATFTLELPFQLPSIPVVATGGRHVFREDALQI
jgi:signal transduction histidine kinase